MTNSRILGLAALLESETPGERVAAAESLAQMADECGEACIPLIRACAADEGTREWAAAALEEMGPPPVSSIPSLTGLLADPSTDAAYWAATLLGRLESEATDACEALAAAIDSERDLSVRERAVWAARKIGCSSAPVQQALCAAAQSSHVRLAELASQALSELQ